MASKFQEMQDCTAPGQLQICSVTWS